MPGLLYNHSVLIFDLEPLVGYDLKSLVEDEDGRALLAGQPASAIKLLNANRSLSCAIVHHSTSGRDTGSVRTEVKKRAIPLITYTFIVPIGVPGEYGQIILRPASRNVILRAITATADVN